MKRFALLVAASAMLASCGQPTKESVEDCVARFPKGPVGPVSSAKMQFDFTYQIAKPEGLLEKARDERARMSVTNDADEQTVKRFLSEPLFPAGAYLVTNKLSLHRVPGPVADWTSALKDACANAPDGAKLYHVNAVGLGAGS